MAARLTDKQKKKILADYVECGSYNEAAKTNGVSRNTVKKIVLSDDENATKCQQKKERNTLDMLSYMDSRKEQAQGVIDSYLSALADPAKIETAKLSEVATAMGILVDKFIKNAPVNSDGVNAILVNVQTLDRIIGKAEPNRNIEDYE